MESLLIKVRKNRWLPERKPAWLPNEDVPAAVLRDFRVDDDGTLSVWHIVSQDANLQEVAVALASTWERLDPFEALLFSPSCLGDSGIGIEATPGKTPFVAANHWHSDLTQVSGKRLVALATKLFETGRRELILKDKIRQWLLAAISDGEIDASRLKHSLRGKLGLDA